jgi:hypothetical protein
MACTDAGPHRGILEKWRDVYRNRPRTVQEVKHAIRDGIVTINREMLRRIFDSFVDGLRQCIADERGRLEVVIDIDILVYLLTAIGLTPGGSSTVHIYTQTIHRTPQ